VCLRCVTYFRIPGKRLASDTFEPAASKSDLPANFYASGPKSDLPQSRKTRFTHVESSRKKDKNCEYILESQGIREHIFDILEGGAEAFAKREQKYNFRK